MLLLLILFPNQSSHRKKCHRNHQQNRRTKIQHTRPLTASDQKTGNGSNDCGK